MSGKLSPTRWSGALYDGSTLVQSKSTNWHSSAHKQSIYLSECVRNWMNKLKKHQKAAKDNPFQSLATGVWHQEKVWTYGNVRATDNPLKHPHPKVYKWHHKDCGSHQVQKAKVVALHPQSAETMTSWAFSKSEEQTMDRVRLWAYKDYPLQIIQREISWVYNNSMELQPREHPLQDWLHKVSKWGKQ